MRFFVNGVGHVKGFMMKGCHVPLGPCMPAGTLCSTRISSIRHCPEEAKVATGEVKKEPSVLAEVETEPLELNENATADDDQVLAETLTRLIG
jgi:hypothetical protein